MKQSCSSVLRLVVFALLVFAFAQPSEASTAVMVPDTDLIVDSRVIVSGEVISVTGYRDDSSMYWTFVEIRTDQVLKGNLTRQRIVLKQLGGSIGDSGMRVAGQPEFSPGEKVILYLNTGPDGSLHTAHSFMGKFSVKEDSSGARVAVRSTDGSEIELLDRKDTDTVTNLENFDSYVRRIRRTLRREAARISAVEAGRAQSLIVEVPSEFARAKQEGRGFSPEFVFLDGPVRWMEADSGQPINYFLNSASCPVVGGGSAEITRAMTAWSNQSGANVRLQIGGSTGNCGIVFDNSNTISFGDCMGQLDPPVGCAGIVALTSVSWVRQTKIIGGTTFNKLLEADTVFNRGMDCFLSTPSNLAEVACHELGHSIGLAHSSDFSAIMWAVAHGHSRDATLGDDDKAGVLAIYPSTGGGGGGGGGPAPVSIATVNVNDGVVGRSYSSTLSASGGTQPYRWFMVGGTLPPGLSFSSNGAITGTPSFSGSFTFAVQVSDAGNPPKVDSRWFTITIQEQVSSPTLPVVTSVRVKGVKKLWIFGSHFSANSTIFINGVAFEPKQFVQEDSVDAMLAKGQLRLNPQGANQVIVTNSSGSSIPFVF